MQRLLDPPRDNLTIDQVMDVLVLSDTVTVDFGMDLLTTLDEYVSDLSPYVLWDGSITRNNYSTVHASIEFKVEKELQWGIDRVRPYVLLSSAMAKNVRFDLGVYVLTTPQKDLTASTPETTVYDVTGYDKLYLLNQPIGDTLSVAAGTGYLSAISQMIQTAGGGDSILIDQSRLDATLPADRVFPLDQNTGGSVWLTAINALLSSISYRGLWCDQEGRYRSEPYLTPALRTPEFDFDVSDGASSVSVNNRNVTNDLWGIPNHWVFVQNGLEVAPVEGAGKYTVDNIDQGLSSQTSLGRIVTSVTFYDAATQDDLIALGNAAVLNDLASSEVFAVDTAPIYTAGHFDVLTFMDPNLDGEPRKVQVKEWSLPLTGGDMSWTWETVG